ncbi:heavy metal translocating P-type ATPase [Desulfuromonas carbonis]|uniref:heavy metal translocating P-type ATPase n=1 Tax=Desulfuromonas sp. DDH964 TaxID=1823759 RepID=UPI00078E10D9|nr:heavy metal translocating P-type ATPase [Desulfuromonas sp. DDH964]AMV72714.1 copper-translocating P-type ATPase [Desulfuromonas sp. DDH964]
MMTPSDQCAHCGLPIPPGERISETLPDRRLDFCCQGCHGAFRIINGAGLDRFYRERHWEESGLPTGAYRGRFDPATLANEVRMTPDGAELTFLVEGVRCATCVWLNEKILSRLSGVLDARLNYASHRARVRFDPARTTPVAIFETVSSLGYLPRLDSHDSQTQLRLQERRRLLIRFTTAAFLSLQLMGFSIALYAGYFQGMAPGIRSLVQWLAAIVTTPVIFFSGSSFLTGAWRSLRNRTPDMELLIALGVLAAYGYSMVALLRGGEVYFDTAAMIVTLVLLGRLLENGARQRAAEGIERLQALAPDTACRIADNIEELVDSALLRPGDLILVRPGERVPVDAAVVSGSTEVDEAVVSGEPLPVLRGPGDPLLSGSLNLSTAVTLRVTRAASESFLARIAALVEEALARKAPVQRLADSIAGIFVPIVILLAIGTAAFWFARGAGSATALLHAVAVLVVACPCALGLATPTAVMVATGAAARRGIFFRGGDVLEKVGRLQLVAFDKTGTLTIGQPTVSSLNPASGVSEEELLRCAAVVEGGSGHPLARGIRSETARRGWPVTRIGSGARTLPGAGVSLDLAGERLLVGTREFLSGQGIPVSAPGAGTPLTEVHVSQGNRYLGMIRLEDPLRTEAAAALAALHGQGVTTAILSGDRPAAVAKVADRLGISHACDSLTPAGKGTWIEDRRRSGQRVMMVGDGINDAPALAAADVGCALAGGTDIAIETSDLVLTRPDLRRLVEAITLGRRTLRVIHQNLFWAFIYNLAALALAASGRLAPIHAAAAMALSSLCVIGNSLRLARSSIAEERGC